MQPILMDADQIRRGIEGAKDENLALVLELPHAELIVHNARDLKEQNAMEYVLGESLIVNLDNVRHVRAVELHELEKTFAELHARR